MMACNVCFCLKMFSLDIILDSQITTFMGLRYHFWYSTGLDHIIRLLQKVCIERATIYLLIFDLLCHVTAYIPLLTEI